MTALHITGPSGSGKTLLCQKALELVAPIPSVYIDCKGYSSIKQVYMCVLYIYGIVYYALHL